MKGLIAFMVLVFGQIYFWAEGLGFTWLQAGKMQWLVFVGATLTALIIAYIVSDKQGGKITGNPRGLAGSDDQGFALLSRFWAVFIFLLLVLNAGALGLVLAA